MENSAGSGVSVLRIARSASLRKVQGDDPVLAAVQAEIGQKRKNCPSPWRSSSLWSIIASASLYPVFLCIAGKAGYILAVGGLSAGGLQKSLQGGLL